MNLVDELLKADAKTADELDTDTYTSKRLTKIIGSKELVTIKIRGVKSRRVNDIVAYQIDRHGDMDYSKTYDAKLMMCLEGIVEPNLRDKSLQEHFNCETAKDLCEKLFENEVTAISDAISALSGINNENAEDDIKN